MFAKQFLKKIRRIEPPSPPPSPPKGRGSKNAIPTPVSSPKEARGFIGISIVGNRPTLAACRHPLAILTAIVLAGCLSAESAPETVYVTRYGLGPDKWASAWLLKRHVDPNAELKVISPEEPLPQGIAFDVEGALYRRQADKATFEVVRERHSLADPVIAEFAALVHAIEVNFWAKSSNPEATVVEEGFRRLQQHYGRDRVTPDCYLAYFDRVYQYLADKQHDDILLEPSELEPDCATPTAIASRSNLVPEMPIGELLAELNRGKNVIFVDVREPEEYAEGHIPGAVNLLLREVESSVARRLAGADYVVSYCVKDFRGFEMARTLRSLGVGNAVILNPYGISGWVASGLPVAGTQALTETEARERLADCARDPGRCLTL